MNILPLAIQTITYHEMMSGGGNNAPVDQDSDKPNSKPKPFYGGGYPIDSNSEYLVPAGLYVERHYPVMRLRYPANITQYNHIDFDEYEEDADADEDADTDVLDPFGIKDMPYVDNDSFQVMFLAMTAEPVAKTIASSLPRKKTTVKIMRHNKGARTNATTKKKEMRLLTSLNHAKKNK